MLFYIVQVKDKYFEDVVKILDKIVNNESNKFINYININKFIDVFDVVIFVFLFVEQRRCLSGLEVSDFIFVVFEGF